MGSIFPMKVSRRNSKYKKLFHRNKRWKLFDVVSEMQRSKNWRDGERERKTNWAKHFLRTWCLSSLIRSKPLHCSLLISKWWSEYVIWMLYGLWNTWKVGNSIYIQSPSKIIRPYCVVVSVWMRWNVIWCCMMSARERTEKTTYPTKSLFKFYHCIFYFMTIRTHFKSRNSHCNMYTMM